MGLKAVLENLDGLDDSLKTNYVEKDGKFYLDLDGVDEHPAVGALKRAKDHEKTLRQTVEGKLREAEDKVGELEGTVEELRTGAIPKGDVEALKKSYTDKAADQQAKFDEKYGKLQRQIEKVMLDSKALEMATEISTAPQLLIPHIRSRLKLEEADGELVVQVVDIAGKPSAASLDDLKKEMLQNKTFAPILIGSKAHGGGAGGGSGGGGASSKKLSDMNEAERTAFAKEDPEGFRQAVAEAQKAATSYS